ncbi:alpha/beta fold hydrolase [Streptomyces sp. NPDC058251]|uniref:alpha/beta fold hydrolase n=1 Tax=Streptomyces sp. NPDC058251 TaxID=3346404 RepID=UPI0036E4B76F
MSDLHYDVCGSGPVLLVIPGGAGHPMGLEGVTERLSERFTVVTYDPLGLSRGPLDEPVGDQRVEVWRDNAHRVLEAVLPEGESACVFGSSSGGIVALDLLARHPERVRRVVAHEPPSVGVLPDAARQRAMIGEVHEICRAEGVGPAMERLSAGLKGRTWEGRAPQRAREIAADTPIGIFLAHVLLPFATHAPDVEALKPLSARLAVGAGQDSRGQLPRRSAELLAELIGADFVEFPGGHLGCLEHPASFADLLVRTFTRPVPAESSPGS